MGGVILVHGLAAIAVGFATPLGRRVFLVGALAPLGTFVWALTQAPGVLDGDVRRTTVAWVPGLDLELALRLDGMALVMVLLVSGVGTLVFAYSSRYFGDRPDLARSAAVLLVFAAAMYGVVMSDNILGLFVFWELTSITSYLLIGMDDPKPAASASALQALLVTGAGGLALLFGLVVLGVEAGTFSLTDVLAAPPDGRLVDVGLVAILVGAFTKSAQVPFHGWLLGAMEAPTPVSAYLHSATMVKAGVFVVATFAPAFAGHGPWRPLTLTVGVATMLWGAYRALRPTDLKLVLAYSTVAALGSMVALFGFGQPETTFAAVAVLIAHALYKAPLFMVVGIVDHQCGTRDLRRLTGLRRAQPETFWVAVVAGASMAAIPLTIGFVSKEAALEALVDTDVGGDTVLSAALVVFSALTVAAVWRLLRGAFGPEHSAADPVGPATRRAGAGLVAPAAVLAAVGLVAGVVPAVLDGLVDAAARSLIGADPGKELVALPTALKTAVVLSAVALVAGAALVWARATVERTQARLSFGPSTARAFHDAVGWLLRVAHRVAVIAQSGSLPVYLTVIVGTLVVLPGVALAGHTALPDGWRWAESPIQAAAGAAVVIAAAAVVLIERRFAAVIALGAVGYSVAVLFVEQSAPDLALTQFLVETVVVVGFLLVLKGLPDRFRAVDRRFVRGARAILAVVVGVFVFAFTVTMVAVRRAPSPTDELAAVAVPEAGGRNIVNVVLTDVRALDTLVETAVIAIAAVGVISLARYRWSNQERSA